MTPKTASPIHTTFVNTLERCQVEEILREHGALVRQRKIDLYALVLTLALAKPQGQHRLIEGLRLSYEKATLQNIARSSFYERLTPQLAKALKAMVAKLIQSSKNAAPKNRLDHFEEVLALDASVLALHKLLADKYPATRTNHTKAAMKLHAVMNVLNAKLDHVELTGQRVDDRTPFTKVGPWVQGRLLLFDLGYYKHQLFDRIARNGGYFLTRLKRNAHPRIVEDQSPGAGRRRPLEGQNVWSAIDGLTRRVIDTKVQVSFYRRAYRKRRKKHHKVFRFVAVKNEQTGQYHTYLTNIPEDLMQAEQLSLAYALRWQVELLFKALKSHHRLADLGSEKESVVQCLVWSSLLGAQLSGALRAAVRQSVCSARWMPLLRWSALFNQTAADILQAVLRKEPAQDHWLFKLLCREAPDPNRKRADRTAEACFGAAAIA